MKPGDALTILMRDGTNVQWRRLFEGVPRHHRMWVSLYHGYLKSTAWLHKKKLRDKIDNGLCSRCGKAPFMAKFPTHHTTYARLGDEDVENDLRTLCPPCHKAEHETEKWAQKSKYHPTPATKTPGSAA